MSDPSEMPGAGGAIPANLTTSTGAGGASFAGFLLVGIASAVCNLASRYGFQWFWSYELALIGANTVGVVTAFLMNRWWVFAPTGKPLAFELMRFVLVNLVGIAVSWITAVALYRWAMPLIGFHWHAELVAHAIGIIVPVVPNYLAHRSWTFAGQSDRR